MEEIKKIMVPVDFSDNSVKLLDSAAYVARKFGAKLDIIFVVQSFEDYSGFFVPHMPIAKFEEDMMRGAEEKMEKYVEENIDQEYVNAAQVLSGDVAEEIIGYASSEKINLIIMGTHGYKGFEKILFGSVAEKVVKTAPCPVLTINPYQ